MTKTATPAALAAFLDDIMPHAEALVAEGYPVDRRLTLAAFERWLATSEEMIAQETERSHAALDAILCKTWTEIRGGSSA